jgi:hypothetical protein
MNKDDVRLSKAPSTPVDVIQKTVYYQNSLQIRDTTRYDESLWAIVGYSGF